MKLAVQHLIVPKDGEQVSGDAVFVRPTEGGGLFAVIDALGHGERAADAAHAALEALRDSPAGDAVAAVVDRVHARLRGTRGAAAMVCVFHDRRLEGCAVGNVELASLGTRVPWVPSPGILGATVRRLRTFEAQLSAGDRLVLFSDGVSPRMDLSVCRGVRAADACRALMTRYRRPHDDATVLIADIEP
ncbi:MAG: SpoIIE family protein phosphatase [Polyangiaceae bacterium]|nr:SpoIIE family protein phosphatase [Polyangiaceae bacterium]